MLFNSQVNQYSYLLTVRTLQFDSLHHLLLAMAHSVHAKHGQRNKNVGQQHQKPRKSLKSLLAQPS